MPAVLAGKTQEIAIIVLIQLLFILNSIIWIQDTYSTLILSLILTIKRGCKRTLVGEH